MEERRIFGSQEPNMQIDRVTAKELWESLDRVFTKQRNITFDRYTFLTRKLLNTEPVEEFYGCLRELSLNCDLGSHVESIIRDVFIANMQDGEVQRELLKETTTAEKALEVAMNLEMGIQNQFKISGTTVHSTTNKITTTSVNNIQGSYYKDYKLVGLKTTHCFLDAIIIVSRGSKEDHLILVFKCLKKLDDDILRTNLPKCHFAKTETEWLEQRFTQSGIAPLESKTAAILNLLAPKNLKQLRSFLGSVQYLGKFNPNLSQLFHPLRPLLKKNTKFTWNDELETHFQSFKNKVANATESTHYNPHLETRIKCDASRAGLGAALEQRSPILSPKRPR